jgi:hypothetical protein
MRVFQRAVNRANVVLRLVHLACFGDPRPELTRVPGPHLGAYLCVHHKFLLTSSQSIVVGITAAPVAPLDVFVACLLEVGEGAKAVAQQVRRSYRDPRRRLGLDQSRRRCARTLFSRWESATRLLN